MLRPRLEFKLQFNNVKKLCIILNAHNILVLIKKLT